MKSVAVWISQAGNPPASLLKPTIALCFESRLAQTLVTILAAVLMGQIGRIDFNIFSWPTFFGMSVVGAPSHDVGIFLFCIT